MVAVKITQLLTTSLVAFLVGKLPLCSAQRPADSVAAYQCSSDYAEVANPPALSAENRMLRVCIKSVSSAVECGKVVDATVTQANKDISDKLIVGGTEQPAFKHNIEITAHDGKCMVAALLTDKYFIGSAEAGSLRVVLSGSVVTPSVSTTSTPANATDNSTATGTVSKLPFTVTAKLNPSGNPVDATSGIKAYRCGSDFVRVDAPHPISAENKMLRVCITGSSSAVECKNFLEATVTQASKKIVDKIVVGGEHQAEFKDIAEITTQEGKCMVAAVLPEKYFTKGASSESLQVVVSGSVSVGTASPKGKNNSGGHHIITEPSATKVPFELAVSLRSDDGDDGRDVDEPEPKPPTPVDTPEEVEVVDGATRACGLVTVITVGMAAVIAVMI